MQALAQTHTVEPYIIDAAALLVAFIFIFCIMLAIYMYEKAVEYLDKLKKQDMAKSLKEIRPYDEYGFQGMGRVQLLNWIRDKVYDMEPIYKEKE